MVAGLGAGLGRAGGRAGGPTWRLVGTGRRPACEPAWAGMESGWLWHAAGLGAGLGRAGGRLSLAGGRPLEAGRSGFAFFTFSLTFFLDLLLVIFSIILDLLLLSFSTPL